MRMLRVLLALAAFLPVAALSALSAADDAQKPAAAAPQQPAAAPQPEEYEKLAAFERVRWTGDDATSPQVDLGGITYDVKELQDFPIKRVLDACRKKDPGRWREVFEEDLVEVLSKLGKPPEGTLKVKMRPVEGGDDRTFDAVWLTTTNLEMVVKNRQVIVAPGVAGAAGAVVAAGVPGEAAKRVQREHSGKVAEPFKPLTERIDPRSARGKDPLTAKQAEEDLDELEWHLVNRYAYLDRSNVDYKAALDSIRAALGPAIPRGAFALQLQQLLALFGDGTTGAGIDLKGDLPDAYLPFLLSEIEGGKLVAYDPGGAGLVDLDRPVVTRLDGVDVEKWIDAAKRIVPGGSPQFVRRQCVELGLRHVNYLRDRLALPRKAEIVVGLSSLDGKNAGNLEMKLVDEPVTRPLPREGLRRTLEGNVGYLRIATMTDDPNFLRALHDAMAESRATRGLVIDIRRNAGGTVAVLRELYPYFVTPDVDKPRVVHVAAYRLNLDKKEPPDAKEGYLPDRLLFPATATLWTDDERDAVTKFLKDFTPEWKPAADRFSAFHATALSPRKGGPYYHYDKPVVVLMDAGCVGAADVFLGAFKGLPNVTLMGTPSGGAAARPEALRLANSGVGVQLSTTASFRPDGKLYDGRGVEPDAVAWPVPNDFIGRTDAVLEAAVKKLQQP
jgi:hypothetical protein